MEKKNVINNKFFDLVAFLFSFLASFYRSIKLFFFWKKLAKKENIFFVFLDFIFRKWSSYFWMKPSIYKLTSFFWDTLKIIFKNK